MKICFTIFVAVTIHACSRGVAFSQASNVQSLQRIRYLSGNTNQAGRLLQAGRVFQTGHTRGMMFAIREDSVSGSLTHRLELLDNAYSIDVVMTSEHSVPFFESRLNRSKLGDDLQAISPSDSAFFEDLSDLANNVTMRAGERNRLYLFETPGAADAFLVAHEPDLLSSLPMSSSKRGQIASPMLGRTVEQILVIDGEFKQNLSLLPIILAEIKTRSSQGWSLISLGRHGVAYKNGSSYLVAPLAGGTFQQRSISPAQATSMSLDEPNWCQSAATRPIPSSNDLRDLLVALSVCSKSEWKGRFGYICSPALWALPN